MDINHLYKPSNSSYIAPLAPIEPKIPPFLLPQKIKNVSPLCQDSPWYSWLKAFTTASLAFFGQWKAPRRWVASRPTARSSRHKATWTELGTWALNIMNNKYPLVTKDLLLKMASSLIYLIYPLNMVSSIAILVYQSVITTTKCEEQAATTNNYTNNKHQTAPDGDMLIYTGAILNPCLIPVYKSRSKWSPNKKHLSNDQMMQRSLHMYFFFVCKQSAMLQYLCVSLPRCLSPYFILYICMYMTKNDVHINTHTHIYIYIYVCMRGYIERSRKP